jgi:hypothetical protein
MSIAFDIHIEGKHEDDVLCAFDEVRRLIEQGFTSGFGNNDSGSHRFTFVTPEDQCDLGSLLYE